MNVRESFFNKRKQYKKLLRQKEKQYREEIVNRLNTSNRHNAKEYWGIVDELKELNSSASQKCTSSLVSTDNWYNHFKNLLFKTENPEEQAQSIEIGHAIKELKVTEKVESSSNDLNAEITNKEIRDAILSLKNNKSCGLDMVKNEMLKASLSSCINTINKMFNKILLEGEFPKSWNRGYIVPLHKSGNARDPK